MTRTIANIDHLISERDLHAYVDGELSPIRRAHVEAYLATHPSEVARVESYRSQNIGLHELYEPYAEECVPLSLTAEAESARQKGGRRWLARALYGMPAVLLVGAIAASATWFDYSARKSETPVTPAAFLQDATDAYRRYAARYSTATGDTFKATSTTEWLAKRSPEAASRVPDLGAVGFKTVGERIVDQNGVPAAHLVYQDEAGRVISLYVTKVSKDGRSGMPGEAAFTYVKRDDVSMFHWESGAFVYALIGDFPRKHLDEVSRIVMNQVSGGTPDSRPRKAGETGDISKASATVRKEPKAGDDRTVAGTPLQKAPASVVPGPVGKAPVPEREAPAPDAMSPMFRLPSTGLGDVAPGCPDAKPGPGEKCAANGA